MTCLHEQWLTRIFPLLFSHVLMAEQQAAFSHLAHLWSWIDRDERIVWKAGTYAPGNRLPEKPGPLSVEDAQIEILGCISDAALLAKELSDRSATKEQNFIRCLDAVTDASEQNYYGDLTAYALNYFARTAMPKTTK